MLDVLFSCGYLVESVSTESMRATTTSETPPPATPNPAFNGDELSFETSAGLIITTDMHRSSTIGDPEGFSPPQPVSAHATTLHALQNGFDVGAPATVIGESKMVYAADLEKEILRESSRVYVRKTRSGRQASTVVGARAVATAAHRHARRDGRRRARQDECRAAAGENVLVRPHPLCAPPPYRLP